MTNLSLFDRAPIANAAPPVVANPPAEARPSSPSIEVKRLISPKAGPFRELKPGGQGELTGREYYIAELVDGRIVYQFTTGEQVKAPKACNRLVIEDYIRFGQWIEVQS